MRETSKHKPPQWMQPCPQDNTSEYVAAQVEHWVRRPYFTEIIHTEVAREIASWFASSSTRGMIFATFATTGGIPIEDDFLAAIRFEVISELGSSSCLAIDNIRALMALDHYVRCVS